MIYHYKFVLSIKLTKTCRVYVYISLIYSEDYFINCFHIYNMISLEHQQYYHNAIFK